MSLVVIDSFTDVPGTAVPPHVGEVGAVWTLNSQHAGGSAVITSANRVRGNGLWTASGVPASPNYHVNADFYVASVTNDFVGIVGRYSTSVDTGYQFFWDVGKWALVASVNGSPANVVNSPLYTITAGNTYGLELAMNVNSIVGLVNGIAVCTMTDSSIATAGLAGMMLQGGSDSTGLHLDNFVANDAPTEVVYEYSFTVTLPPDGRTFNARIAQTCTPPVQWVFQDTQGNAISMAGKTVQLRAYLDTGGTQATAFVHDNAANGGITVTGNLVMWQPIGADTQTAQVLKYELIDTTDGDELARGVIAVSPP